MTSELTRREFIGRAAGAAVLFGFQVPLALAKERAAYAPNAFIRIDERSEVTFIIPQVEMGQGTYTSLGAILAEELDADWNHVRVEHAPADEKAYANPMLSIQATGNSNSVRAFWKPLRQAGADTRACLIEAAAREWKVPSSECRAQDSKVLHEASGRSADYGMLIGQAAALDPLRNVPLKDPSTFRLVGRPLKRLDTAGKTNGRAVYGIDVLPPGVKFATLAISPVLGGTVAHVDDSCAESTPSASTPLRNPSGRNRANTAEPEIRCFHPTIRSPCSRAVRRLW